MELSGWNMVLNLLWYGLMGFSLFVLIRNEFTFRSRIAIIDIPSDGLDLYAILPDYRTMVLSPKYWLIWTPSQWLAWIIRRRSA